MGDDREVPRGRLSRLSRLARVGARAGLSAVGKGAGDSAAKHAAEALGTLRGLAAKAGQMAAYVDGIIPEGQRTAYERSLSALFAATPASSPDEVRAVIEEDLGAPLEELFEDIDDVPVASASIGQVHRGRLADGREVAVKVQHPGVAEALKSDLDNARIMERTLSMAVGASKFESKRVLAELRERFLEELDYELEAERQRAFRAFHADDERVLVPEVIDSRSTRRVLTTEWAVGKTLDEAREGSEAERAAWAETLWRFVFRGVLVGGMFNADPHPGNYFFASDGRVWFLDFGCVQQMPVPRRETAIRAHLAAAGRDEDAFRDAIRDMLHLDGGLFEERALGYVRHAFAPLFDSPYRITREYVGELVRGMRDTAVQSRKSKNDRFVPMPEGMALMNRLQFGFYSIIARLDVELDFATIERRFLLE